MSVPNQRGVGLLELVIAAALAAIVLGPLLSLTRNVLQTRTTAREANEMVYQARFALDLIVAKAQATVPKVLSSAPPVNSTGDWFGPAMYCLKTATGQLVETTTTDGGCTATRVIADNVTAFSVQRPAATGALDKPVATIAITVGNASGTQSLTLAASTRLGGNTP